jgi:hypothetical protein
MLNLMAGMAQFEAAQVARILLAWQHRLASQAKWRVHYCAGVDCAEQLAMVRALQEREPQGFAAR